MTLRRLTLRQLIATLLGLLGLLVGGLFLLASLQLRAAQRQTDAENRRAASFLIADGMRQSSNDLTNMVRLYVVTGAQKYRSYYEEILAVRAGTKPRPLEYDSSFWDRVLAEGKGFVQYGDRQSLSDQMRAARFAPEEFAALTASLDASNALAKREREVMAQVAPRIAQGVDRSYTQDVAKQYSLLVDNEYLAQKGQIMRAIRRFTQLVEARTADEVAEASAASRQLALMQIAIVGFIGIIGLVAMGVISRVALRPLARLLGSTRRIAAGDYAERAEIRAVSDLEELARAFNEMAVAVETDIAARAAAERDAVAAREAAEQASQAKSRFLAAMTHELRTPMIGVTGMLEILAHTDLSAQQRGMIATAEGSARSLLQIIGDVLDFSKIEADKLELAPVAFDLRAVVGAAADTFAHAASAKGLLLSWSVDERLAEAHVGDPLRVRQILTNLVSNAVKFTEVGGIEVQAVLVESGPSQQRVAVTVRDTGIGVSEAQQDRLFRAFGQAEAGTSQQFGGTGLGLAICRRLARLMGGDVTMQSALGAGTTMRFEATLGIGALSAVDPMTTSFTAPFGGARNRPSREQAEREGSLILLAEDHPVNRAVIVQQLGLVGFCVDVAEDGQEAFERFAAGRYGLVLTDLNMPRMTGVELATAIRRHERRTGRERTPILALSANVMQGEPEQARQAGMDDFMAKPTTIPFLATKLREWLPELAWDEGARSSAAPDEHPLDGAALEVLTGGDEVAARSVLEDFVRSTASDLDALRDAIAERNVRGAQRAAHRIRGAALTVGARHMARLAGQIEDESEAERSVSWERLEALTSTIDDAAHEVATSVPAATR